MSGWLPVLVLATAFALPPGSSRANGELAYVRNETLVIKNFRLRSGAVMPEVTIAYETYGDLAPDGRNAVLLTHGQTSSHHLAGADPGEHAEGSWNELVGPGKAIDTDKLFVVSSNVLGSSYGSTGPAFVNPATGKPYGPDFPEISVVDIVTAQHRLLERLGVKHLVAVAGASFGGFQAFQWGVTFPDFVDGIVAVASVPKLAGDPSSADRLIRRLARDPNWNGGRYYENGGVAVKLTELRIETLKVYGIEEQLASAFPDPAEREAEIRRRAESWAKVFDANSLVVLRRAAIKFDAERDFSKLRAKVLYVLMRSDQLYPPPLALDVISSLVAVGVQAEYVEIDSDLGHAGYGREAAQWGPELRKFVTRLTPTL